MESHTPPAPPATPSTPRGGRPSSPLSEEERLRRQKKFLEERLGGGGPSENLVGEHGPNSGPGSGQATANGASYGSTPALDGSRTRITPEATVAAAALQLANKVYELRDGLSDGAEDPDDGGLGEESDHRVDESPEEEKDSAWPGVVYGPGELDIVYRPESHKDVVKERDLKVIPVTMYLTQYSESGARKIAVCSQVISYAVKHHIRAIARGSTSRCLLKGHSAAVVDMEFFGATVEGSLSDTPFGQFVLGSSSLDGSVYLWYIDLRPDEAGDVALDHTFLSWTHPKASSGSYYSKIRFDQKSEKPRFALVDGTSMDIRIFLPQPSSEGEASFVEGIMSRSTPGAVVQDVAWVDAWTLATASVDGAVCLWDIPTSHPKRIFYPFGEITQSPSLGIAHGDILVTCRDFAKEIKLWKQANVSSTSQTSDLPILAQTLRIANDEARSILAVDPSGEFLVLSNIPGKTMYVIHINGSSGLADCLTEIPVRQSVLSLCLTRKLNKAVETGSKAMPIVKDLDEVSIWCVLSKTIQLYHLPATHCLPPRVIAKKPRSVGDKERSKASERDETMPVEGNGQPTAEEMKAGVSKVEDEPNTSPQGVGGVIPRVLMRPGKEGDKPEVSAVVESSMKPSKPEIGLGEKTSKAVEGTPSPAQPRTPKEAEKPEVPVVVDPKWTPRTPEAEASPKSLSSIGARGGPAPTPSSSSSSERPVKVERGRSTDRKAGPLSEDALCEAIRDCFTSETNRIIEKLETQFADRDAKNKEVTARLLATVSETVESNVACFVDTSIGKEMEAAVTPGIEEHVRAAIDDALGPGSIESAVGHALRNTDILANSMTSTLLELRLESCFRQSLDSAHLGMSYSKACKEMTSQIVDSLTTDTRRLIETKIGDALATMIGSASDAHEATEEFQRNLARLVAAPRARAAETPGVDPALIVESFLREGKTSNAFETALTSGREDLVLQLCRELDIDDVFSGGGGDDSSLSQRVLFLLVDSLSEDLSAELELKIDWIREALIVMEPTDDSVPELIESTLTTLISRLRELISSGVLDDAKGASVLKQCKVVIRLASSLAQESRT